MDEFIEREVYRVANQNFISAKAAIENIRTNNPKYFLNLPVDQTLELYEQMERLFNRIKED
jgi:hypothetical protein